MNAVAFEFLVRGIAIGTLGATALGFLRAGRGPQKLAALFLWLSITGYAINSSRFAWAQMGPAIAPFWLLSLGGVGFFWAFVATLFDDTRWGWRVWTPAALLTGIGVIGMALPRDHSQPLWIAHNLVEAGFGVHALALTWRSWRDDLIEERRRLRGPFVAVTTFYVIVLSGFEISEIFGLNAPWLGMAGAVALAVSCISGAAVFLEARRSLLGVAKPLKAASSQDVADRALLARLEEAMNQGEAWRRDGLTIGALAGELKAPEHRLRRLINDHLGHRNFAAFVNAQRIEAAKRALAAPEDAHKTIASIAFDLGFGSLGPFNRAFKEATGLTPSQWRSQELGRRLSDS